MSPRSSTIELPYVSTKCTLKHWKVQPRFKIFLAPQDSCINSTTFTPDYLDTHLIGNHDGPGTGADVAPLGWGQEPAASVAFGRAKDASVLCQPSPRVPM